MTELIGLPPTTTRAASVMAERNDELDLSSEMVPMDASDQLAAGANDTKQMPYRKGGRLPEIGRLKHLS
jgi:hypothetical protein